MSDDCVGCSEAFKSNKKILLESDYKAKVIEGTQMAKDNNATGFFIALSKNQTGYIIKTEKPAAIYARIGPGPQTSHKSG